MSNTTKVGECLEYAGSVNAEGYGITFIGSRTDNSRKTVRVHRYILELLYGKRALEGTVVCHKCNNRLCVNPLHLHIGTHKDNYEDAVKAGTVGISHGYGTDNPRSKLDENKVLLIRELHPQLGTQKLMRMFNVGKTTINDVVARKRWNHV